MTDQDLRSLLREHVTATEPPFTLQPQESLDRGHRLRTRRRLGIASVGLVAAAVVTGGVLMLPDDAAPKQPNTGIDPATAKALEEYDASAMPALMDERIRAAVGDAMVLGERDFAAKDDQEQELLEAEWDRASSMATAYGWRSDHRLRVRLGHGRGSAEGSACQEQQGTPTSFEVTCDATTLADGTVVETTVTALYPDGRDDDMWIALTPRNLESGLLPTWVEQMGHNESRAIDPTQVYFGRTAKAVHSETFVTTAQEFVQATSYDEAMAEFELSVDVLTEIVTDPVLVIPRPKRPFESGTALTGSLEEQLDQSVDFLVARLGSLARDGMLPGEIDTQGLEELGMRFPDGTRLGAFSAEGFGASASVHVCLVHDSGTWIAGGTNEARMAGTDGRCR